MRQRDAERAAKRFVADRYTYYYEQWNFDICFEHGGDHRKRRKAWSFGLTPDEEHPDYEPGRTLTGYVHADGTVEGLY
jgi:hypothetical protein